MKPKFWKLTVALILFLDLLVPVGKLASGSPQEGGPFAVYLPLVPQQARDMVTIPAGEFVMGCDPWHDGGEGCQINEQPLHTIYLEAFLMDRTEVTNAQYARCVAAGACTPPNNPSSFSRESYYGDPSYAYYPVIYVNWYQAGEYCQWAGKRLPTEAEWEKAAGGHEQKRAFPWGDQVPDCMLANYRIKDYPSNPYCVGDTARVGSTPAGASPYGLLDMAGNVWEMVGDWYQTEYYSTYPPDAWPPNPTGPQDGTIKVYRGGSWDYYTVSMRAANRGIAHPLYSGSNLGFRCAADLP